MLQMLYRMWTGSTDVLGKSISNKQFTVGGIAIGIASTLVNNLIEREANKDEYELYVKLMDEIKVLRQSKQNSIDIIALLN